MGIVSQEKRHDDSTSVSTIGNFFYRLLWSIIEGALMLASVFFSGVLSTINHNHDDKSDYSRLVAIHLVYLLPKTAFLWLYYLYLKIKNNIFYGISNHSFVLRKLLAYIVMIGASCYLLAVPFNLNLLAGAASIFAHNPQEMLLALMINVICYSPLGLGMSFSLVSVPFLLSIIFVGLPAVILSKSSHRGSCDRGIDQGIIPLLFAGLFVGLIAAEKVAMMYWSISLLGMINVPLVLVALLTTCLVVGRVFSIDSIKSQPGCDYEFFNNKEFDPLQLFQKPSFSKDSDVIDVYGSSGDSDVIDVYDSSGDDSFGCDDL